MITTTMKAIGTAAYSAIIHSKSGRVFGRTSRGDFLLLDDDEIIFLSFEHYRGPRTANIQRVQDICERIQTGDKVSILDNSIFWPEFGWRVTLPSGKAWSAAPPEIPNSPFLEISSRLSETASGVFAFQDPDLISSNLISWLSVDHQPNRYEHIVDLDLAGMSASLRAGRRQDLMDFFSPLIGLGSGLTPAGDDLILGYGLAYSRWGSLLGYEVNLGKLIPSLFELVDSKTTLLSRSLIKAAWEGQADERLIEALDGLVTGIPDVTQVVEYLASWGNHSGGDALTGMALFLLSIE